MLYFVLVIVKTDFVLNLKHQTHAFWGKALHLKT